jgi:hypothetical protein
VPYKERDTGVMCITPLELMAQFDKEDGLEPGTSMQNIFTEMDEGARSDSMARLKELQANPNALLGEMLSWCDADTPDENPTQILAVDEVEVNYSLSGNSSVYTGRLIQEGQEQWFRFTVSDSSGPGYYDPPDNDGELETAFTPFPIKEPK